jgi:hypothetical protein
LTTALDLSKIDSYFETEKGKEDTSMPQTVEAFYHDGVVELKEKPKGIERAKALVIFLDSEEPKERSLIDWNQVRNSKSSVDKWIGILEGVSLGDWKAERRTCIEGKTPSKYSLTQTSSLILP